MAHLIAHGRPPTAVWAAQNACPPKMPAKESRLNVGLRQSRQVKKTYNAGRLRSEPGIAEKAIEIASEVLDTDLTEVLETVQTTASDAVLTTQGAIQVSTLHRSSERP